MYTQVFWICGIAFFWSWNMILKIHKCNKCHFGQVGSQKQSSKYQIKWPFLTFFIQHRMTVAPCCIVIIVFDSIMSEYEHIWLDLVVHVSPYGRMRMHWYVWKNKIMCMSVCASMHERSVRCTVCLNAISVSVSVDVCACAHVCLYDGGGGRAGIMHTRSTSQRLGGPSPTLMATHVNPTTQKIGQWNTTHSHTETRTRRYTHMHQYQLKESQSASRASALSPVCDPRSTLPRTSSCRTDTSSGLEQQD